MENDIVIAVNGKKVGVHCSPMELLLNQANSDVNITVKSIGCQQSIER
jgi:aerobic-type carbon monoxide dehydrogenase small subunit (CoxS/CutS family)